VLNCEIIFYAARKTSFCERALSKSFSELDLKLKNSSFAIDSKELGSAIIKAFDSCNLIFIISNLSVDNSRGVKYIMSKTLANVSVDECKKLKNELGEDGYVIRSHKQVIVMLPDEPEQIEGIMQGQISRYIQLLGR
jgi:hypothetical protein